MFDIPATDDPRTLIEMSVPVKGRRPMILRLPRYDMIDEPVYKTMFAQLDAIDAQVETSTLSDRDRARLAVLAMLKLFTSEKDYGLCENLAFGQLIAIRDHWTQQSGIPLGEFVASTTSPTGNTEAQSNTISSPAAITSATSDAA